MATGNVLAGSENALLEILTDEEDENYEEMEAEFDLRYLQIPQQGSRDSYQDMVDFIETVENERLQDILGIAIQSKGAFGRFKDVLGRSKYELERNRWSAFSEKHEYDRAVDWLKSKGFKVAESPKSCVNQEL